MGYTPSQKEMLFKKVIKAIEKGASLRAALRDKPAPTSSTFAEWLDKDDNLAKRYARATLIRADLIFEDILSIADENYRDTYVDDNGIERTDHDVVQRSKLRIDARKWYLSKMHPTKYGDKLDVTSGNKAITVPAVIGMVIKNETNVESTEDYVDDLD